MTSKVNGLHATDLLLLNASDGAGSDSGGAKSAAGDRVGGALLGGSGHLAGEGATQGLGESSRSHCELCVVRGGEKDGVEWRGKLN